MEASEVIEATEDEVADLSRAVEVRAEPVSPATLSESHTVEEMVARVKKIQAVREQVMKRDVHYGVIPGTSKPTLLKPGAEILAQTFLLDLQLEHQKIWDDDNHHLSVDATCVVYHAPTGIRLGRASGFCSTREEKYAWRKSERVCPDCGAAAIAKKKDFGRGDFTPGWFCWAKKGGCGHEFAEADPRIVGQEVGRVANPDITDMYNTVVKMGEKRAMIAAVLIATGASSDFTQDAEDAPTVEPENGPVEVRQGPQPVPVPTLWPDLFGELRDDTALPESVVWNLFRAACVAQFGIDPKAGTASLGEKQGDALKATQAVVVELRKALTVTEPFAPLETVRAAWKTGFPAFEPPDEATLNAVALEATKPLPEEAPVGGTPEAEAAALDAEYEEQVAANEDQIPFGDEQPKGAYSD
jgi:hypothetical protein